MKPTKDIKQCRSEGYRALVVPHHTRHDQTVHATLYTRYNLIGIGLQGEGQPEGGIVTDDPELVRWFAKQLLELADLMSDANRAQKTEINP